MTASAPAEADAPIKIPLSGQGGSVGELLTEAQQREVLRLRLEHHVEVHAPSRLTDEVLEPDRVDQIGVRAQLRQHQRAFDPPADALAALLHRRLRRRVMDLWHHTGRPRRERKCERLAVGNRIGIVTAVVEGVPHDRAADPLAQAQHGAEAERAVVVLDGQAGAGSGRKQLEAPLEAIEGRVHAAGRAADVEDDHGFGSQRHGVHELGLHL